MKISDVAEKTGLSIDNLRYYERIGLIPPITQEMIQEWKSSKIKD